MSFGYGPAADNQEMVAVQGGRYPENLERMTGC